MDKLSEIYWTTWLFVALPLSFGMYEAFALKAGRTTLSRYIWTLTAAFPPFGWIAGGLTGFLGAHFFWPCMGCPLPSPEALLTIMAGG